MPPQHMRCIKAAASTRISSAQSSSSPLSDEAAMAWLVDVLGDTQAGWTADPLLVSQLKQPVSQSFARMLETEMTLSAADVAGLSLRGSGEIARRTAAW